MTYFKFLTALLIAVSSTVIAQTLPVPDPSVDAVVAAPKPATAKVVMQTMLGPITLELETERAPITAANFLHYVDQKRLDGIGFYRAVKITEDGNYGLVQGGLRGNPKREFKPIAHEPTTLTGLSHVSGAISMARLAPGTATMDFFIVLGDLPGWDAQPTAPTGGQGDNLGYAVFGHVIDGMDVVRAIIDQPRSANATQEVMKGQMLETPVKILTVRRAE